jgi:hypothetical protein
MLRKFVQAGAMIALLAGTAHAQYTNQSGGNTSGGNMNMNMMPDTRRHLTPEEAQRERDIEAQYNRTVNDKIPDKKSSNDPWGNLRSAPTASSSGKPQRQ